jgi:integrase
MKSDRFPITGTIATLQDVLDRLSVVDGLTDGRRRDLRSAVACYAKILGVPPAAIPIDLATIRETLDAMVPAQAKVSAKRWANRRSDLAAAFAACGLMPILKTAKVKLDPAWAALLVPVADPAIRNGLSRFARWATLRGIAPTAVDMAVIERFVAELMAASLARHIGEQYRTVAWAWNALVALRSGEGMRSVALPERPAPVRVPWQQLPAAFREDVERHLAWCAVPDPLDPQARGRALAPATIGLRRNHIHSAIQAVRDAGVPVERFSSLANLVDPDVVRAALTRCWIADGRKCSAYTQGVAGTLVALAKEWVRAPAATIVELKRLRTRLGKLATGMTEKNKALLRLFDDHHLLAALMNLPDRLWHQARRGLGASRRPFIDLQTALAVDILIHVPLRMENLSVLTFGVHLHWPQGRGKPALIVMRGDETKNSYPLEFEIPAALAERLRVCRNEIAPAVTGKRSDALFVAWDGTPITQEALTVRIERAIRKHLGVKMTPHQFRHLAAKVILDADIGAIEQVRQMLGHKNTKTTMNFYAGIDTKRAGRAHAGLLLKLREESFRRKRRRQAKKEG